MGFAPKAKEAIFLHWTMTVTNGALVALMNDPCNERGNMRHKINPSVKIVVTSGPKIWPETVKTWSIKEDPEDAKNRVWLSSAGDTLWNVPDADQIATFEEREMPKRLVIRERTHAKNWGRIGTGLKSLPPWCGNEGSQDLQRR